MRFGDDLLNKFSRPLLYLAEIFSVIPAKRSIRSGLTEIFSAIPS
jgi:hypothetical protein